MAIPRQQLQFHQRTPPLRRLNGPAPRRNFALDLDTAAAVDEFKRLVRLRYRGETVKRAIEIAERFIAAQRTGKTIKIDDVVVELL